jgi:CheY-like chemotaxis protein
VAHPQRSSLLIVEDDPDIRESVAEILGIEGYSVAVANNGLEGLNLLAQIPQPCIILLDMMMPVMTGPEFLARLKADPVLRDCTVLIMTAGHAQPPPGAAGLIRKPFELPDLLAFVNRHCP